MADDLAGWNQQAHIIDTAHHRIHQGRFFTVELTDEAVIAAGVFDGLIVLGDEPAHVILAAGAEANARLQLYEDTVTSADGNSHVPMNHNRYSSRVSTLRLYDTPVVTSVGTQIDGDKLILAGRTNTGGAEAGSFLELILKDNTKYLVRLTNLGVTSSAQHISLYFYEPTSPV